MQINTKQPRVTRSHVFEEGTFQIEANPIMFEILSSRIYTDVPRAIVRELSTNAADSHVEAGNAEKPFEVHLPSTWDPYFSIRDFGTGLSHEDITTVYTVFGSSTRRTSNDFTGCLGLGSKTPFAYTSQFMITSRHNGTKRVYSAFKNEQNLPAISLMDESETDEANGLEIRIEIKPPDIRKFQEAAQKVYQFFDVRPNLTGARIDYHDSEPIMEGEGWKLYRHNDMLSHQINVLMGKICYSADGGDLRTDLGTSVQLLLDVPLGECSIAASREELQYDDLTNKTVTRMVRRAEAEIRKNIDEQIKDATCDLDRYLKRMDFAHIIRLPKQTGSFRLNVRAELPEGKVLADGEPVPMLYTTWGLELRRNGQSLEIDRGVEYIRPQDDNRIAYFFIEDDINDDKGFRPMHKRRVRAYLDGKIGRHFLVKIHDREAWSKVFGKPTIKVSELPEPPRETVTVGSKGIKPTFIKLLSMYSTRRLRDDWRNVSGTIDAENAYYVVRKGNRVAWNKGECHPDWIRTIANAMGCKTVYGISASRAAKLADQIGLESLEERAEEWINEYVKTASKTTLSMLHVDSYQEDMDNHIPAAILETLKPDLSQEVNDVLARMEHSAPTRVHRTLVSQFGIGVPHLKLESAAKIAKRFFSKYPLLEKINVWAVDKRHVTEYIEMIEARIASRNQKIKS